MLLCVELSHHLRSFSSFLLNKNLQAQEHLCNESFALTLLITTHNFPKAYNVFMVLTSALCPGVSPVVLLTICAGLASKAIPTLTLPGELLNKVAKQAWHITFVSDHVKISCERINSVMRCVCLKLFRSKCSPPHYMRTWQSCWDHNCRAHSPSRWPGSSGWGHSGHTSDPWHLADTGTALWHADTHSPHAPYTGCRQCPGSCMYTLRGK